MVVFFRPTDIARELIAKYGRVCTWRALDNVEPDDTARPWIEGAETSTDNLVNVVFFPSTRASLRFLQTTISEPINIGDDYGIMSSSTNSFMPTLRAQLYDEAGTTLLRDVKSIDPLAPNGEVILYTLQFTVSQ